MNNSSYYVHESSIIGEKASIGKNTKIWQFCNIMDGVEIGDDCNIGQNVFIEMGVSIGNHVKIKNNIAVYKGVRCEDDVFLGPNVVFTNVINPRAFIEKKDEMRDTPIQRGATLGANSTIICGNTIGKYALIGAGSVVNRDVGDYELVVGNPIRHIGFVCECGETLQSMTCPKCGKKYVAIDEKNARECL